MNQRARPVVVALAMLCATVEPAGAELMVEYETEIANPAQNVIDVAVDAGGNAWVVANAARADAFATTDGALESEWDGAIDVWVGKFDPDGNLVYGTYLPTSPPSVDQAGGIAVDRDGNAYVVGQVAGALGTVTPGAFQTESAGNIDTFLVKLSPNGALLYGTYLSGSANDSSALANDDPAAGVAVDDDGNVYVVGATNSSDFPVAGAVQETNNGDVDWFVMKFDADFDLQWSTYYGGGEFDYGKRVAVDAAGGVYAIGWAGRGVATSENAFQTSSESFRSILVLKLTADGAVAYATYVNGSDVSGGVFASDIGVDADGQAAFGGNVFRDDVVTTPGSFQPDRLGASDAFFMKLNATGTGLAFSTYLGGSQGDGLTGATGVGPDGSGFLSGITVSGDFPVTDEIAPLGRSYLARLSADGADLLYATRLDIDRVRSLEVDAAGSVYLIAEVGQPGSVLMKISETGVPTATIPPPTPTEPAATATTVAPGCVGDCDEDGTISISELVRGVGIALGNIALTACPVFDVDGNESVSITELVQAVNAALDRC